MAPTFGPDQPNNRLSVLSFARARLSRLQTMVDQQEERIAYLEERTGVRLLSEQERRKESEGAARSDP